MGSGAARGQAQDGELRRGPQQLRAHGAGRTHQDQE